MDETEIRKIDQKIPAAATPVDSITGAAKRATDREGGTVVSSIVCCNQGGAVSKVRLSLAIGGAGHTASQYFVYDKQIAVGDVYVFNYPITLAPGDVIRVESDTGSVSFNAFGLEQV
jgi:hypothetical protein